MSWCRGGSLAPLMGSSPRPSICPFIHLSIQSISPVYPMSIMCPSVHPSTHPYVHPSTCLSTPPSNCPSIHQPVLLKSIYPSTYPSINTHPLKSIYPPVHPTPHPSVHTKSAQPAASSPVQGLAQPFRVPRLCLLLLPLGPPLCSSILTPANPNPQGTSQGQHGTRPSEPFSPHARSGERAEATIPGPQDPSR